jgi:hypothetical protein
VQIDGLGALRKIPRTLRPLKAALIAAVVAYDELARPRGAQHETQGKSLFRLVDCMQQQAISGTGSPGADARSWPLIRIRVGV